MTATWLCHLMASSRSWIRWEVSNQTSFGAGVPSYCSISLADCLVNTAFEKGSMDNMAAVVVPLKFNLDGQSQLKEQSMGDKIDEFASGLQMKNTHALPYKTLGPLQLKAVSTMFNESLVCSQGFNAPYLVGASNFFYKETQDECINH